MATILAALIKTIRNRAIKTASAQFAADQGSKRPPSDERTGRERGAEPYGVPEVNRVSLT